MLKRTLQRGEGSFPIDTPMHDATVRIHYSIHAPNGPGDALYSTHNTVSGESAEGGVAAAEVTTGDGLLPTGVEMAIKLMLPGERCEVLVQPKFGLGTCIDGVHESAPRDQALLWKVQLQSFEKEVHPEVMDADQVSSCGQRPACTVQDMLARALLSRSRLCPLLAPCVDWPPLDLHLQNSLPIWVTERRSGGFQLHECQRGCAQMIAYATKQKVHANKLYESKRLEFAIRKYDRAVAVLKKFRDVNTDEHATAIRALQVSLLSNLAAAHMAQKVRHIVRFA